MSEFPARVAALVQETPRDRTLRLAPVDADLRVAFTPGQHVCLADPTGPEGPRRYFSVSAFSDDPARLSVTIRRSAASEPPFYGTPLEAELLVTGPMGDFRMEHEPGDTLLLLGAGSGVTPFRAFVESLLGQEDAPRTVLLQSARCPGELLFRGDFMAFAVEQPRFRHVPVVTGHHEGWPAPHRLGRDDLARRIQAPERTRVYACGPQAFVEELLAAARELGVPPERCHREGG